MRKLKDSNQKQSKGRFSTGTSGSLEATSPFIPAELLHYGLHQDLIAAHEALGRVQALLTLQPSSDFILRAAVKWEAIHSNSIEGIDCSVQDMLEVDINYRLLPFSIT